MPGDGAGDGVIRVRLQTHRDAQHVVFASCGEGFDLRDLQLALREGAGLVHGDDIDLRELFDGRAAAEEHAMPRSPRDGGQNRRRNRQNECAGAHHHQQRHGAIERGLGIPDVFKGWNAEDQPPHEEHHRHDAQRENGVARAEAVGEALARRPHLLRRLNQRDDLRQGALRRRFVHAHLRQAPQVQRPAKDRRAGFLRDRHRLTRQRRFIRRRETRENRAIDRKELVRLHHDDLAHAQS